MTASAAVLLLAIVSAPQVEVSTIEGTRHSGTLTSADAASWKLETDGQLVEIALSSILEARLPARSEATSASQHEVILLDGSRIGTKTVQLSNETLTITAATPMAIRYSFWNLSSTTSWGQG